MIPFPLSIWNLIHLSTCGLPLSFLILSLLLWPLLDSCTSVSIMQSAASSNLIMSPLSTAMPTETHSFPPFVSTDAIKDANHANVTPFEIVKGLARQFQIQLLDSISRRLERLATEQQNMHIRAIFAAIFIEQSELITMAGRFRFIGEFMDGLNWNLGELQVYSDLNEFRIIFNETKQALGSVVAQLG